MTQVEDTSRDMRITPDSFAGGYFRNAVYRHWDPYEDVPQELLESDRQKLIESEMTEAEFDGLRGTIALFGAGEEAVTEDLAPLAIVLDDIDDQMFITSQLYEEAKHTQFFDRYWRAVIDPVARSRDFELTQPTDQRYFNEEYIALFEKNEAAMKRLLTEDSAETRAKAYCHYHLTVESVLAQTGYYGLQSAFSPDGPEMFEGDETIHLEGLIEGITYVRSDEGRHVGFGMQKVRELIQEDEVSSNVVQQTLQELMGHVAGAVQGDNMTIDTAPLVEYAQEKITRRIEILTEEEAELPPVEELVKIEDATAG
ncbi:ferritin family protein [Halocatena halophila]|uniref:ribonucleoside-diphosphate reductase n=1 Tax=Halocatena halophila TaxID=2814576 RepID=UPI002ED69F5B